MEIASVLAQLMLAGVVVESIVMMGKRMTLLSLSIPAFFICLIFGGMTGYLPFMQGYTILLFLMAIYIVSFTLVNHSLVVQTIDERVLSVYTMAFWYVYLSFFPITHTLTIILMVPTLAIIYLSLTTWVPTSQFKLFFYTWYLLTSAALFIALFTHGAFTIYFQKDLIVTIGYAEAFFGGMVLYPLSMNVIVLYYILPIHDGEEQPIDTSRLASTVITRYSDEQMTLPGSAFIILFMGAIFAVNMVWRIIDDMTLVNMCIIGVPQMSYALDKMNAPEPQTPV